MFGRARLALLLPSAVCFLTSCSTSIHNLKVPIGESPAVTDSSRIHIDDARPQKDRVPRLAKDVVRCERWFGDDTLVPSKLVYLDKLFDEHTRFDMKVHIRLTRFDIVEYCEQTVSGSATTAAAAAAGSIPYVRPAPIIGDTVVLHLAGEINGMTFDESRQFDYATLYKFSQSPSANPIYRALLRTRLDEIIDAIVKKASRAELR